MKPLRYIVRALGFLPLLGFAYLIYRIEQWIDARAVRKHKLNEYHSRPWPSPRPLKPWPNTYSRAREMAGEQEARGM